MKTLFYCLALVSASLLVQCNPSKSTDSTEQKPKPYTIAQFMNTIRLTGSAFSPDETKILFTSNQSGIFNAYEIAAQGGALKPLTDSKKNSVFAISYFPTDERLLFTSDNGGNEITNIYRRDTDGKIVNLTPDSTAKATFMGWSFDKKSFYYITNKRNPQFFDLYEMDITSFQPKLLYKNKQGLDVGAISDNKRYLALTKSITTSNSNIYLYDLQTKKTTLITSHTGEIANNPQTFSTDNKKLYFTTDEGSEYAYIKSYDLESKTMKKEEEEPWDISYMYFSRSGKYKVIGINNDAKTEIKIYNTSNKELVKLPLMPSGEITGVNISDSEKQMAFYVSSSKSPNSLYVYDFESGKYKELVNAMNSEINPDDLVEGEVVRFKSYDGLEVPNILYKPKSATSESKVPVMLLIHGGPGGQTRLNYSPMVQYLVNHGYAILAVNNRGSSGYGKTFFTADDQKHGDADLKDCVTSKKYLATLPWVDTTQIGIMGGSYGGYMTLAALAFTPDEFKVGVDIFGVANWLRTLKSIPPWWGSFKDALYKEMGNPATDSVALYNKSPLFHTDRIKKPLLVIQGKNDPRVLKVESDEIVAAVKKNNVPVEYIVFDDEGHGFVKKENEIKAYEGVLLFLDKHLKNTQASR